MRKEMIIEGEAVYVFPWYDGLGEAVNFGEKPVFDDSDLIITDLDQDKLMYGIIISCKQLAKYQNILMPITTRT